MRRLLGDNIRRHDIVFYPSGRIDISARVAHLLALSDGDVVDIADDGGEYFLYVRLCKPLHGRFEARVFRDNGRGGHMRTYSRKLRDALPGVCGNTDVVRFCVGEPLHDDRFGTMLPIITKMPL